MGAESIDVFNELKKLKENLARLAEGENFTLINSLDESKDNKSEEINLSTKIFLNKSLHNKVVDFPQDKVVFIDSDDAQKYSQGVFQATYVIASLASEGLVYAIANVSTLKKAFDFLGTDKVPKIIDDRTYKIGQELNKFLETTKSVQSLGGFANTLLSPFGGVGLLRAKLIIMQKILEARMANYVAHSPENINIKELENIFNELNQNINRYSKGLQSTKNRITEINSNLVDAKNMDQVETLLTQVDELEKTCNDNTNSFWEALSSWNKKISQTPPSLFAWKLAIGESNQTLVNEWVKIYNSGKKLEVSSDDINDYSQKMSEYIAGSNLNSNSWNQVREVLNNKFDEVLLKKYEEDVAKIMNASSAKTHVTPQLSVPTSVEACTQYIKELDNLKNNVLEDKNALEITIKELESSLSAQPIKNPKNHPDFSNVYKKNHMQLVEQSNQLDSRGVELARLIEHENEKLEFLKAEQDIKVRDELLSKLSENVNANSIQIDEIAQQIKQIEREKADFEEQFTQSKKSIYETNLKTVKDEWNLRKKFLASAKKKLQKYKDILLQSDDIDVLSTSVPEQKLKKYLECSGEHAQDIETIYSKGKDAAAYGGFNVTNIWNKLSTYMQGNTETQDDIDWLLHLIVEKLALIDNELEVIIGVTPTEKLTDFAILSDLNARYLAIPQLTEQHILSCTSRAKTLEDLKLKKESVELAHTRACLSYESAVLKLKLADIEKEYDVFQQDLHAAKGKSSDELNLLGDKLSNLDFSSFKEPDGALQDLKNKVATLRIQSNKQSEALAQKNPVDLKSVETDFIDPETDLNNLFSKLEQRSKDMPSEFATLKKESILSSLQDQSKQREGLLKSIADVTTSPVDRMRAYDEYQKQVKDVQLSPELNDPDAQNILKKIKEQDQTSKQLKVQVIQKYIENLGDMRGSIPRKLLLRENLFQLKEKEQDFLSTDVGVDLKQTIDKEINLLTQDLNFKKNLLALSDEFFGKDGVFEKYLQERHRTYWFKDFVSNIAAFSLSCFGWKTDSQQREEFVTQLKLTFIDSIKDGNINVLSDLIVQGQQQFSPRARNGSQGYEESLSSKLVLFGEKVYKLNTKQINMATEYQAT